ncbi:MAG: PaRep2b protein [Thermoproteus sp.]
METTVYKTPERELRAEGGVGLYGRYAADERMKRALFYATLALEEAFDIYESTSKRVTTGLKRAVWKEEVDVSLLKRARYVVDLVALRRLAEEEERAFEDALRILRKRLNEYIVKYDLRSFLNVDEDIARRLADAKATEFSKFNNTNFGVKAYAALLAYRDYAVGRRSAYGTIARYWLKEGGAARLLYYAPNTAYNKAERTKVEGATTVEETIAEALRRLFLKPGAEYYRGFIKKFLERGHLILERGAEETPVYRVVGLKDVKLKGEREKVKTYVLMFGARWREVFKHELAVVDNAVKELKEHWPLEDPLPYMLGWLASDVSIDAVVGRRNKVLHMSSSHFWQVAETKVLFGWSDAVRLRMSLTLEGPKLQLLVHAPIGKLDEAVKSSRWLRSLGVEAGGWEDLKRWAIDNWRDVVDAAARWLGGGVRGELNALVKRLNDDKVAREAIAPALLLIQAEKLGIDKETVKYFAMVVSAAIGGDGYVSAAGRGKVVLIIGNRTVALLWRAVLVAYGIKAKVKDAEKTFHIVVSGDDAVKLARLYVLYGPPLLKGDKRTINHKLAEAIKLGIKTTVNIGWKVLRKTKSDRVAADLTISEGGAEVKYSVYLRKDAIELQFNSTDRGRTELAARLLKLIGVDAEVKRKGGRDVWYVEATTDKLAAGHEKLRGALVDIVKAARSNGWVDADTANRWLEKLEGGITLKKGWPKYNARLVEGTFEVRYQSTNPHNIEREVQRLRAMGLVEGVHFAVKMPKGGKAGYVSILKEGLAYAARLSIHGSEEQRRLAAEFVEYILQRAREEGDEVYEKAAEIVEEGRARSSLSLADVKGVEVEVEGKRHVIVVLGGGAEFDKGRGGRTLLRIKITAEVDGVRREYTMTFSRRGSDNAALGRAYARADAPGGREADAERLAALVRALTGREPRVRRRNDGTVETICNGEHLYGLMRYSELADAVMRWLAETKSFFSFSFSFNYNTLNFFLTFRF